MTSLKTLPRANVETNPFPNPPSDPQVIRTCVHPSERACARARRRRLFSYFPNDRPLRLPKRLATFQKACHALKRRGAKSE